jgi:hypothetical protein
MSRDLRPVDRSALLRWLGVMVVAIALANCGNGKSNPIVPSSNAAPTQPTESMYSVGEFVTGVATVDGMTATMQPGVAPQPSGGPPVAAPPTPAATLVTRGSTVVRLSAPQSFQAVYLSVGNVPRKVGGFWQLQLPAPTTDLLLVVQVSGQVPSPTFDLQLALSSQLGVVGPYSEVPTNVIRGTSELEITVWWDKPSDVDLNVIEPSGEEVYWGNNISATGGMLDQDSNIECVIDNKNNESIRWTKAPSGTFAVRLDYYSSCGVSETKFVVAVNHNGTSELYQGTFTGPGSNGAVGKERLITTLNVSGSLTSSQAPAKPPSTTSPRSKRRIPVLMP